MIEKHVVSLEVAEKLDKYLPRLKGLNTFFNWVYDETWDEEKGFHDDWFVEPPSTVSTAKKRLAAPILSEMLELLPKEIDVPGTNSPYFLKIYFAGKHGTIRYLRSCIGGYMELQRFAFSETDHWDNVATAAAQLLIWLVDNKYVEVGK